MTDLVKGNQKVIASLFPCAAREPRWKRIVWPHSYDPASGITWVRWFWHPIHLFAATNRLRWRWMAWSQRNA